MKPTRSMALIYGLIVFFTAFVSTVSAEIMIEKDAEAVASEEGKFSGTIVLTYPDGRISILESSDEIPAIPSGSTIEIFDGNFSLASGEQDEVTIACLGVEFSASGSAAATLTCGEENGRLVVRSGQLTTKDDAGNLVTIAAPNEFPIALGKILEAAPTAAVDPTGFDLATETVPDSRNIDASPVS